MYLCYNQATVYLFIPLRNDLPPHQPIIVPSFPLLFLTSSVFLCHLQPFFPLSSCCSRSCLFSTLKLSGCPEFSWLTPPVCLRVFVYVRVYKCVYVCVSVCSLAWHGETNWFVFTPLLRTQRGLLGNCQDKPVSLMHASAGLPHSLSVCVSDYYKLVQSVSVPLCTVCLFCVCKSVCERGDAGEGSHETCIQKQEL